MSAPNLTVLDRKGISGLEVAGEIGEVGQFEELAACGGLVDVFALQRPGEVVRDEDGVEAGGEGWINVGFGAVADHPCGAGFAGVMGG